MVREPLPKNFEKAASNLNATFGAFDRLLTNNPRTQLDISSFTKFSPERLRLFLNGSREFVQYGTNDSSKFSDSTTTWDLQPGSGDTMHLESAESATYVVGTEMKGTLACQLNQSLQGNDKVKIGFYDGSDGWYIEHRGDHANDRTVDLVVEKGGSRTVLKQDIELPRPLTDLCRYALDFNWYNVGHQTWTQTYTVDGRQINKEFAQTSRDGVGSTNTANLNIWFEVQADASTTGLQLQCGSMSFIVQSNADQLVRGKPQRVSVSIPSTNNVWHPIYAIRLEEDTQVNCRMNELQVLRYSNNAAAEVIAVSVDPSKTDASGFGVPSYSHSQNTVVEDTTSVSTVPDASDGSVTDPSSTSFKPGGWTVNASSIEPSGTNFQSGASTAAQTTIKRQVLGSDIVVFCARSSSAGGTLTFDYVLEQDW